MAMEVRIYMRWTNAGVGVTGLTPTFTEFKEVNGADLIGSVPTIYEVAKGKYYFDWDLSNNNDYSKDVSYEVDGGAGALDERYFSGVFGLKDAEPYVEGVLRQYIHFKDNGSDIEGVTVKIYNSNQDEPAIYPDLLTDANGKAEVYLKAGSYKAVGVKPGYTFSNPYTVTVTTPDATHDLTATAIVISAPSDPTLCRVYIFASDYDGVDDLQTKMIAQLIDADPGAAFDQKDKKRLHPDGYYISDDKIESVYYTAGGYHYIDLIRLTVARIDATNVGLGENFYQIPDQGTVDFVNLVKHSFE